MLCDSTSSRTPPGARLSHETASSSRPSRGSSNGRVQGFYARRAREEGHHGAETGSVTVRQRVSSDLLLKPQVHAVFLDGAWHEQTDELVFVGLGISEPAKSAPCSNARSDESKGISAAAGVVPRNEDESERTDVAEANRRGFLQRHLSVASVRLFINYA